MARWAAQDAGETKSSRHSTCPDRSPRRRVLLVVITYRSMDTLPRLMDAVSDWLEASDDNYLTVVDNGASVETIEYVRTVTATQADRVLAAVADANLGFAPGVNVAVERARQRWGPMDSVLLVNPDIETTGRTLKQTADFLNNASIGVAAPRVQATDGLVDRGAARRFWTLRTLFAEVVGVPRMARFLGAPLRNVPVPKAGAPIDVDITTGAFMAIRSEVFGAGMDTRLPMYLEDQEICHRAHEQGFRVVIIPELKAVHVGGHSRERNTSMRRDLRMMELAAAPTLSLLATSGVRAWRVRLVVFTGGAVRFALAAILTIIGGFRRGRRQWAVEQVRLAGWFMAWAAWTDVLGYRVEMR